MEKAKVVIKTSYRCPRCSKNLVIVEDRGVAFFGCVKCDCYLIVQRWQIREFKRKRYFDWRGLMEYLFSSYVDLRKTTCK